jgi:hypothetical protein
MITNLKEKTIQFIGMPSYFSACSQVRIERKEGVKADVIEYAKYPKMSKAAREFGYTEK